jgi:hypothetical protein
MPSLVSESADLSLGRIDLADAGAKLVVDVSRGSEVTVGGVMKRRQRRMFLDATSLSVEGNEDKSEERADKPSRSVRDRDVVVRVKRSGADGGRCRTTELELRGGCVRGADGERRPRQKVETTRRAASTLQ